MTAVNQAIPGSTNFGVTNNVTSFGTTPTVGRAVIAVIRTRNAAAGYTGASSVVDNQSGNIYTRVVIGVGSFTGTISCEIWWCPSIVGSTGTFTVTATNGGGASANGYMDLLEVSGLSGVVDKIGTAGDGGTPTLGFTVTASGANTGSNDLVVAGMFATFNSGAAGLSNPPTSGYTSLGFNDGGDVTGSAYKIDTGSGQTDAATWAWNAATLGYGSSIATFSGVGAAPASASWLSGSLNGPGVAPFNNNQFLNSPRSNFITPPVVLNLALTGRSATFSPGTVLSSQSVILGLTGSQALFKPGTLVSSGGTPTQLPGGVGGMGVSGPGVGSAGVSGAGVSKTNLTAQ